VLVGRGLTVKPTTRTKWPRIFGEHAYKSVLVVSIVAIVVVGGGKYRELLPQGEREIKGDDTRYGKVVTFGQREGTVLEVATKQAEMKSWLGGQPQYTLYVAGGFVCESARA